MQKSCLGYPVEFVEDIFGESTVLADTLKKISGSDSPRVLIVADMNVVQRTDGIGSKIGRYVQAHGIQLAGSPIVIAGGEKIKADNLQSALKVIGSILSAKLGKNDIVLALGGGTILDIAGYAASQVRGGVKIVRVPTTPASMLDAAFAEYASVNTASVKDALRVPSIPAAVMIDTSFALSVLDGVWRSGIGEAVRLAVAQDSTLMKKLVKWAADYKNRDAAVLNEIVKAVYATRAKKGGTQFALWSAIRLESMSNYKLPHGYAVAIGICVDLNYSVEKGLMKAADRDAAIGVLRECGALDGLTHSYHLINQTDNLMLGLDAWRLLAGNDSMMHVTGLGKSSLEESTDRVVMRQILKKLVSSPEHA